MIGYYPGIPVPSLSDCVIIIAAFLSFCFYASSTIYLFQIKEYRFDRLFSQIREDGLQLMWKNIGKRPTTTIRNMLIFVISTWLYILVSFLMIASILTYMQSSVTNQDPTDLVFHIPNVSLVLPYLLILDILLTPVIASFSVIAAVLLTEPLAQYKRKKLIARAAEKVKNSKAFFIGISGTYGKSTTKEYLYHILSQKFKVAKTDENMNTDVGVAISILKNLQPDTEYFVAEVGAYKRGEVRRAAAIFNPRAALMLPFGNQHIDLFGSKENLVAAESEILEFIPNDGMVYVNADIPEIDYVKSHTKSKLVTYSITKKADIYATDISATEKGSTAKIINGQSSFSIETKLLGKHVIQNLLSAIAFAADHGMTTREIANAIATLEPVKGKLSVSERNGAIIINDASNSSLNGFLAALDTIRLFGRPNAFILSKGIRELGKEKKDSYEKIITHINKDLMQLATDDKLFKQFDNKNSVTIVRNEAEFLKYIVSKLDGNTVVLLEGKFTKPFIEKLI